MGLADGREPEAGESMESDIFVGILETNAKGSRRILIGKKSIGVWGVFVQNIAFAVIIPIWCIAHLSLSRTVSSRRLSDYVINVPDLAGIAFAMVNVYILLTVSMSLPAPSVLSHDLKQWLLALWQFFPVWVSVAQVTVSYLLSDLESGSSSGPSSIRWMRALYAGLLTAAGLGQAKTLTLMWTSAFLPGLFADSFVGVFNFSNVFLPSTASPYAKTPSITAGALLLLQYDYMIGSIAVALWSTVLFVQTYRAGTVGWSRAVMGAGGVVMVALTGPLGYAAALAWARDELLVVEAGAEGKKVR